MHNNGEPADDELGQFTDLAFGRSICPAKREGFYITTVDVM